MANKIKTLKDLNCSDADHPMFCHDGGCTYGGEELMNEAKKWTVNYGEALEEFFEGNLEAQSSADLRAWIIHFFNLDANVSGDEQ